MREMRDLFEAANGAYLGILSLSNDMASACMITHDRWHSRRPREPLLRGLIGSV